MFEMPPVPAPEGLHPIVVHFPIGLLLAAPVFVVLGFLLPKRGAAMSAAALLIMVLGTLGLLGAVYTGEEGEDAAEAVPAAEETLERHEELAETTRNVFLGLTVLYAVVAFGPAVLRRQPKYGTRLLVHAVFLAIYAVGCLQLARTAHEGGRLVHEHGVRAWTTAE